MTFSTTQGGTTNFNDATMTEPDIRTSIDDINGAEMLKFTATASAVNEFTVANAATGGNPTLSVTGDDTNIDLVLAGKGSGSVSIASSSFTSPKIVTSINDTNGAELIKVTATGSAINEITIANASVGTSPSITASGDDTNIDLILAAKGSGAITLTSPKITTGINDANGLESILLTATGSAVNEVTIANAATAGAPTISATGDDADIDLALAGKGTGAVTLTSPKITTGINDANGLESILLTPTGSAVNEVTIANAATAGSPTISATGDDTNIDLTLAGKGSGAVATTSPKITTSIDDVNGLELLVLTATGSAVNEMTLANAATGTDPSLTASGETNVGLDLISKGTGFVSLVADDTDAIQVQKDTNVKIGFYAATPVVQPATAGGVTGFSAGSSTSVLVDSTFTGNVGSATYTISDVVKALKDIGLMAA